MKDADSQCLARPFDDAWARSLIERRLDALVPEDADGPLALYRAQRYTLLRPAKRVRAILTLRMTEAWGAPVEHALDLACALEMIHAASLIVDDLPCMDNAELRRGVAANHLDHGEATSILSAFALIGRAFEVVAAAPHLDPSQRVEVVTAFAFAIGPRGLSGGQQDDLHATMSTIEDVERVHRAKTVALFCAAAEVSCVVAKIVGPRRHLMMDCGSCTGLAFQAFDDLIDAAGTISTAGKDVRQDDGRPNIATMIGLDAASERAERHLVTAIRCLEASGARTEPLTEFLHATGQSLREKWQIPRGARHG